MFHFAVQGDQKASKRRHIYYIKLCNFKPYFTAGVVHKVCCEDYILNMSWKIFLLKCAKNMFLMMGIFIRRKLILNFNGLLFNTFKVH